MTYLNLFKIEHQQKSRCSHIHLQVCASFSFLDAGSNCWLSSFSTQCNPIWTLGWCCCDRKSRAAYAQIFALWQQATMEFTCHDHSSRTLVITFNPSHVSIGRTYTPRSLCYCLFAPHMCMVLFFTHIPFVVNHTTNATPPERLQQCPAPVNQQIQLKFCWKIPRLINILCILQAYTNKQSWVFSTWIKGKEPIIGLLPYQAWWSAQHLQVRRSRCRTKPL